MKSIIITASDSKYYDFLENHWLKSLHENVNLKNIDILVLDYGFTKDQKRLLKKKNVIIKTCKRDGHVTTIRHRDASSFLKENPYNQVLFVDSGDIIFQTDISDIFEQNKDSFRAVVEFYNLFHNEAKIYIKKEKIREITNFLKNKPMINAGVIFGPSNKFIELFDFIYHIIENKDIFGPDQVAINYFIHNNNFKKLKECYNFLITTAKEEMIIKDGKFFSKDKILIPIVHNAGGAEVFRPIEDFGFGEDCNKIKPIPFSIIRTAGKLKHKIKSNFFINNSLINIKHL